MSGSWQFSNVIGFDDAPFAPGYAGRIKVVGTVFTRLRLDGIVVGDVLKDGEDATDIVAQLAGQSKFASHIQLVMLQGIALGGFNVVDAIRLSERLKVPVLVVARKQPDISAVEKALIDNVDEGLRKWQIIQALGAMEPAEKVWLQRVGLGYEEACGVIRDFAAYGNIPEPLRMAHLIAGAMAEGQSRGRA